MSNTLVALRASAAPAGPATPQLMTGATWVGRGDDVTLHSASVVRHWNNRVASGANLLTQASSGFAPTQVTSALGGTPASVDGVHFGSGGSLDQWSAANVSAFVSATQWHMFAVVHFDSITANDGLFYNHNIFCSCNTTTAAWVNGFSLTVRDNAGTKQAVGYFHNGTTAFSASATIIEDAPCLIEWYGDGSIMGIRVNAGAAVTASYSGNMRNYASDLVRSGSLNYEGGWDITTNRLFELAVANQKNADVSTVRSYFAARYNLAV